MYVVVKSIAKLILNDDALKEYVGTFMKKKIEARKGQTVTQDISRNIS